MEDDKYYGLRELLPKFRSTSVVVLSGNKRGGGKRRGRKRFDGKKPAGLKRRSYIGY